MKDRDGCGANFDVPYEIWEKYATGLHCPVCGCVYIEWLSYEETDYHITKK
jgi:hypothetical protein